MEERDETRHVIQIEASKIELCEKDAPWTRYLQGVIACFRKETNTTIPPLRIAVLGDVPLGAGLSSSAALEVAMATVLEQVTGIRLEIPVKARLCQRAEHEFAGVPCGIMDQYISAAAEESSALLLDCKTAGDACPVSNPETFPAS